MNGHGQSDRFVVPANLPNKAAAAEAGEERERAKGNAASETCPGRSAGPGVASGLDRVREVARRDKDARFTALLHHVNLARLWAAYVAINPKAAPGVDRVTWDAYGPKRVNWVLDADIRDFFSSLDRGWLEKFLRHRIADERVLRLIQKWLNAGVIEDGRWTQTEGGPYRDSDGGPVTLSGSPARIPGR